MSKGVIRFFERYPSFCCSLALFGLCALAGLNQQLNLNLPSSVKVRDKADFSTAFATAEKLDIRSVFDGSTAIPSTSYVSSYGSRQSADSEDCKNNTDADFAVCAQSVTSNESIDESETRILAYKNSFFFGHSTGPLDWVKSASKGNTISINGILYRIVQKTTLPIAVVRNVYYSISEYRSYRGKTYDAIIMTCGDGTFGAHGNDNNYRTFLFVNRI